MHAEKGVFESIIDLLLDILSKTMDGLSARKDLQALEIWEELHPQERTNGRAYLPPATTPSQLRRKGQFVSVCSGSESPQDSQQT
jgi:hypothetical protein